MGVAIYAVLLRRGVPRWLAALAAAPVLLDAYELQIEQTIMPDVWFEALMWPRSSCCCGSQGRRWRDRPAGIALGLSVTTAQVGEILILPAAIYVAVAAAAGGGRSARGAVCVSFALPILAYMSISQVVNGHFWLSRSGDVDDLRPGRRGGRLRDAAVPAYERPLCPTPSRRRSARTASTTRRHVPADHVRGAGGMSQSTIVSRFTRP